MDCLATSVQEVKFTRCITMIQAKSPIIKANQTICTHHVMKTPKAKLISAKKSKIYQELENRTNWPLIDLTLKLGTQGHLRPSEVTGLPQGSHKLIVTMTSGITELLFTFSSNKVVRHA